MSSEAEPIPNALDLAIQRTDMADKRTRWAADRTLWAADRTFIAWLRTSISMIGFGVTIGKAGEALENRGLLEDPYHGFQILGIVLITLAVLGLMGALIQDIRIGKRLERQGYGRVEPTPLSQVMGFLVLGSGILCGIFIFV